MVGICMGNARISEEGMCALTRGVSTHNGRRGGPPKPFHQRGRESPAVEEKNIASLLGLSVHTMA